MESNVFVIPSHHLLVQIEKWKQQNNLWNLLKTSNRDKQNDVGWVKIYAQIDISRVAVFANLLVKVEKLKINLSRTYQRNLF